MATNKSPDDVQIIMDAVHKNDHATLLGSIAHSLLRIASAQEAVYELAVKDMNEAIEAAIQDRAETLADDLVKEKTSRSFIGKR